LVSTGGILGYITFIAFSTENNFERKLAKRFIIDDESFWTSDKPHTQKPKPCSL
jgi:hypothetical protein